MSRTRRVRIFDAAGGACHICGGKIRPGEAWDAEHVIPLEISGDDTDDNLRPAHVKCHRSKTAEDAGTIAKAKRVHAKHIGADRPRRKMSYRRFNGEIVWR
jgi:5-methylcytosine-specific restriction enzyme A